MRSRVDMVEEKSVDVEIRIPSIHQRTQSENARWRF